ncbi:MAG: L,D-transpeptidase family protein [Campylobacterota bacterium]|nr:L,D-transpeptidase family protein [Campylobacterota bacterium]
MKNYLLTLLLTLGTLNADLVEMFRTQGIQSVQQYLEKQLTKKEYWAKYLENKDVSQGYYETIQYVLVCQKDTSNLKVYHNDTTQFKKLFDHNVLVGENQGDKKIEGDKKTPTGAYDLTKKLKNLDPFYGPLAMVTSYPNLYDKIQKKNGHGIWIHGVPQNDKRDNYTKGCIALENSDIKALDTKINLDKSILIISDKYIDKISKKDISIVLGEIFSWKETWKQSQIKKYLSFYSNKFKRNNGMDIKQFKRYKTTIFSRKEKKKIVFSNINIMPYPNSQNKKMFRVVMDEDYRTANYQFKGKKELFIELLDNKMKILTES